MDPQVIATAWLLRNASDLPRHVALEQCTQHLIHEHGLGRTAAAHAALHALAERESTNTQAWIDADASTSHLVVLRRPGKQPLAFTIRDLLRMADERALSTTTH